MYEVLKLIRGTRAVQMAIGGGFLVALQDKARTGNADVIERFGETVQTKGAGGSGIAMYKGSIYAEINDKIVRYSLPSSALVPPGAAG